MRYSLLLAPFLILTPSCGTYWSDRLRDLDECFLVDLELGYGARADARVGPIDLGAGLGSRSIALGKPTWWQWAAEFEQSDIVMPASAAVLLFPESYPESLRWLEVPLALVSHSVEKRGKSVDYRRTAYLGWGAWNHPQDQDAGSAGMRQSVRKKRLLDAMAVEAGVFLGFAGVRAGFNVAEFADFLVGLVGLDLFDEHMPEQELAEEVKKHAR